MAKQRYNVRVTPRSSRNEVVEEQGPSGSILYKVYVNVPPVDDQANIETLRLMAKHLGLPKSHLTIVRGAKSRDKLIEYDAS